MGQRVSAELPIYVSEVPEYEPRGDCIRISWRHLEFFLPVPIARAAIGRFHRALDKWHEDNGAVVVPFRQPRAVE